MIYILLKFHVESPNFCLFFLTAILFCKYKFSPRDYTNLDEKENKFMHIYNFLIYKLIYKKCFI